MRCIQCGAELPAGSRFCSSCGAKQPEAVGRPVEAGIADERREAGDAARAGSVGERPQAEDVAERPQAGSQGDWREAGGAGEPPQAAGAGSMADRPEARPAAAGTESARDPFDRRGRDFGAAAVPPPVAEEPIAVRLTQSGAKPDAPAPGRYSAGAGEEEPPQMRPVSPDARPARSAYAAPADRDRSGSAGRSGSARPSGGRKAAAWVAPTLLAVCAAGALVWQTGYERDVSAETTQIQRSAADAALGGNYEIAESKLSLALAKRPNDSGIRSDLDTVRTIRRLDDRLTDAQRLIGKKDAAGASAVLDEVQRELAGLNGSAYDRLRVQLDKLREKMELVGIRSDAERADSLAELGGLMRTAADYPARDKAPVLELITDRIVKIGGDEAEQAIASGSYYEAAAVVDEARSYVPEAERLIELDKEISSLASDSGGGSAGELIELLGSELQAGTGELKLSDFGQRAQGGKVAFSGTLTNVSNTSMSDLLVEFRAYDAQGTFLGEDWTEVRPGGLKPGETASFADEVKSAGEDAIIVIDSVSWYRE
ncbi:FxLYD domain-containing protein [Saccharibacillus brassicae]|uniref:Zinc-ribbon domain-containing protein n=1 Tax=Saccharibacillus brassicae TaxID=2583377 RepID=A0A4Y6UYH8_SACBS|nr:FxLYD domain-containing protein [Saccharibacillus brassicae]QDH21578.1 zinc-ribbon domain-containing protein [Saccharibacillus brassicae]